MSIDPDSWDSLAPDIDALIAAWDDRGVSGTAAWTAFAISALRVARRSGLDKDETLGILSRAWDHADDVSTPAGAGGEA